MASKQTKSKKRPAPAVLRRFRAIRAYFVNHPALFACVLGVLYLLFFQRHFLFSGDVWAETHAEYLENAIKRPYREIFTPGWAGYLTLVPSLLAKFYVFAGFPIGYIDFYYQAIIVVFALACAAYCASRKFVEHFGSAALAIGFSLLLLVLLNDKAIFSFINIWYLGFIPIMLLCLSGAKLGRFQQVVYVGFGALMAFTKPSLILLPFVIYRLFKTREYLSNTLLLTAIIGQTLIMLLLDPRNSGSTATRDIPLIAQAVFTGGAAEFLKLLHIRPTHFVFIVAANLVLSGLFVLVLKKYGWVRAGLLGFGYAFSVYAYVLAPDAMVHQGFWDYAAVFDFNMKVQREFPVQAMLLLLIMHGFASIGPALLRFAKSKKLPGKPWLEAAALACLALVIFKQIPLTSAQFTPKIDAFRHTMNIGESTCVPLPPTPLYSPDSSWVYEHNTDLCHGRNFEFVPDFKHMNTPLVTARTLVIPNNTPYELKTVYLPVRTSRPHQASTLVLQDMDTEMRFTADIPANPDAPISFAAFNVAGLPFRTTYHFRLFGTDNSLYWGKFKDADKPIHWPFFAGTQPRYIRQ